MQNIAKYLQFAVLAFFVVFLILFISFDTVGSMFGMDPLTSDSMVKVFLTGFILFLATWGAVMINNSNQATSIKKMQDEMNTLKAKLYDFEHPKIVESKKPQTQYPLPSKNQDDTPGNLRPRQNFTDQ